MAAGGSYVVKDGKPVLQEQTKNHPEGNRPRDEKGQALNRPAPVKAAQFTGKAAGGKPAGDVTQER